MVSIILNGLEYIFQYILNGMGHLKHLQKY